MAILSVRNLSKDFIDKNILKDITFHVEKGDKIGLIGQNGSGKTTLLNILSGELTEDEGDIFYQKDIHPSYLKQHTKISSKETIFDEAISVFDDIFKMEAKIRNLELEISKMTEIGKEENRILNEYSKLSEKYLELNGPSVHSRVTGVLKGLGFSEEEFDKKVNELSGGQKSRINLGKLLLSNPNFMFLDEPTNHLDIESINWLESYLRDYNGTFIVVSHDRFFLDNVVNKIFLLENHKLETYNGNYSKFYRQRKKDLEIRKKQYENQQKEIEREEKIIQRFLSVGREKALRQGLSRLKKLEKLETIDPVSVNKTAKIKFHTNKKSGYDVFIGEDLSKSYGDNLVFENVSFRAFKEDRIGIIGGNGVGKSTLFKILSGELKPDSGELKVGTNVFVGYFDQEMSHLDPEKSIIEEIWDAYPDLTHFQVRSYLAKMMFVGDDILKEIKTLSGGEKARVSILKLMLSDSNVLLMDEPTNHLDIDSKEILEDALKDYEGTVISISHDRYFLNHFAEKIWEMKKDGITEYLGDYNYYYEKTKELEDDDEKEEMTYTEKRAIQKEKRKKIRENQRKRKKIEELESKISQLKEKMDEIDKSLQKPEVLEDYEKILELGEEREKTEKEINKLMEKWIELN